MYCQMQLRIKQIWYILNRPRKLLSTFKWISRWIMGERDTCWSIQNFAQTSGNINIGEICYPRILLLFFLLCYNVQILLHGFDCPKMTSYTPIEEGKNLIPNGNKWITSLSCHELLLIMISQLQSELIHSKKKKYFQAPFLVLQLVTNRGLVSVPGRTYQC